MNRELVLQPHHWMVADRNFRMERIREAQKRLEWYLEARRVRSAIGTPMPWTYSSAICQAQETIHMWQHYSAEPNY